jgi:hypothetical protein
LIAFLAGRLHENPLGKAVRLICIQIPAEIDSTEYCFVIMGWPVRVLQPAPKQEAVLVREPLLAK